MIIRCHKCTAELYIDYIGRELLTDGVEVHVSPCVECLGEKSEEDEEDGRKIGYEAGLKAGRKEGAEK